MTEYKFTGKDYFTGSDNQIGIKKMQERLDLAYKFLESKTKEEREKIKSEVLTNLKTDYRFQQNLPVWNYPDEKTAIDAKIIEAIGYYCKDGFYRVTQHHYTVVKNFTISSSHSTN